MGRRMQLLQLSSNFMMSIKARPIICNFLFIRKRCHHKSKRLRDLDADPGDKLLTSQMYFYITAPLQ
jgi:hypothetical protein